MEIKSIQPIDINIRELDIPDIDIWEVPNRGTPSINTVPVTVDLGTPIVNIPGCVEANTANNNNENLLVDDDPVVICDAGVPSFGALDYNKEDLTFTGPPVQPPKLDTGSPDNLEPAPQPTTPQTPKDTTSIQCPTQEQLDKEPVGFLFDGGRKEVLGYKLVGDQCIREVGDVPIVTQVINGLPPTGVVITTGGIAVVATTSALLAKPFADILLKVIKPTVKKVLKKVASIRGKKMKVLSVEDRRAEQRDRNQAIAKLKSVKAKTKK